MAETKKKRPPRQRPPKQNFIPGADPSIPEIDDAAERYCTARDARQSMLKDELDVKEELHGLMKQHKLKKYEYLNKIVEVVPPSEENIKVRTKKAQKIELNGEADDGD